MSKADALIITCTDHLIQKTITNWLEVNGLDNSDRIYMVGGSKDIVKPIEEFNKSSILYQIRASVALHTPDRIILIDHQDCGAFVADDTIKPESPDDIDLRTHTEFLKEARKILKELYPQVEIETYYVDILGEMQRIFSRGEI